MNIKKIFIPWVLLSAIASILSAVQIYRTEGDPIWLGALIAVLPLPAYLMFYIMPGKVARTSQRLPSLQIISAVGLLIAITAASGLSELTLQPVLALAIAANGVAFVQWFVRVFSSYGREKSTEIVNGEVLTNLPLTRLDGTEVSSSSFRGSKTLVVFFRANWCPLCMAQLKEVVARAGRLAAAGVEVKFVSNQGIENHRKLAEKLDLPENFELLQDEGLVAAKRLHIEDIGGAPVGYSGFPSDTVMATVIALDENGVVIFGDETDNYRVRPHPDTFLQVFEDGVADVTDFDRPVHA